jgi:hypothetical protein
VNSSAAEKAIVLVFISFFSSDCVYTVRSLTVLEAVGRVVCVERSFAQDKSCVDDLSAIRMQYLPGEIGTIAGSKKHITWSDFHRLARAPQRCFLPEALDLFRGNVEGISGVHIGPGATALTRMLRSARALASDRVNATMAPLVAE